MLINKQIRTYITYILTLLVLILLIVFAQPQYILSNLLNLGYFSILFLILIYLIDLLIRTIRWKILLRSQGINIPVTQLLAPLTSALAINIFTIARAGETIRVYSLKRYHNVKLSDTLSSIIIEQISSVIGLIVVIAGSLVLAGGFFLSTEHLTLEGNLIIVALCVVCFLIIGIVVSISAPQSIERIINYFPPLIKKPLLSIFKAFQNGIQNFKANPLLLIFVIMLSASIWCLEGIMLLIITNSVLNYGLNELGLVFLASSLGNLTFVVPILPGAMGEYEVVVALILSRSPNYPQAYATIVPLIDRILKSILLMIFGGYSTIQLGGREILRYQRNKSSFVTTNSEENSQSININNHKNIQKNISQRGNSASQEE